MHHIERVHPFVALRPTGIFPGPATIAQPRLHKFSIIVKYFAVVL